MRYACDVVENGKWQHTIYSFPQSCAKNLKWLSPELLKQDLHGYNEKSDIYSLGMTICELAKGTIPFCDMPETLMLTEKVRGCVPQISSTLSINTTTLDLSKFYYHLLQTHNMCIGRDLILIISTGEEATNGTAENSAQDNDLSLSRKFSDSFHKITEVCLQYDPSNRPSIGQLLNHSFFKQCRRSDTNLAEILQAIEPLHKHFANFANSNGN